MLKILEIFVHQDMYRILDTRIIEHLMVITIIMLLVIHIRCSILASILQSEKCNNLFKYLLTYPVSWCIS